MRADHASAPTAILFNGGVFTPASLRGRIVDVLHQWFDVDQKNWSPLVLTNPSLDLAVAWGAAYFAWLKHTGGRRIGGGIARSYYVAVQGQTPTAKATVLCVVPQRLEEGQEIVLAQPELELALGQPVMFPLYTSTVRAGDKAGDLLEVAPTQLLQLPPLHTVLRGGKRSGSKSVPVTLAARCTEIGTLELWCVAKDGQNRWRLEFSVRDIVADTDDDGKKADAVVTDVWPEGPVQEAAKLIRAVFLPSPGTPGEGPGVRAEQTDTDASALTPNPSPGVPGEGRTPDPRQLTKALEASLEAGRDKWPTGLCRRLWEFLAEVADQRKQSPAHLARWNNLVGFCLRPGFGDPLDKYRVEQLWKLLHASPKGSKPGLAALEGGADFWIMWRRVAGGLPTALQNTLFSRLRPVLLPGRSKTPKPAANEYTEMWRAAASLERLDLNIKNQLGEAALKQCRKSPTPPHAFFAVTRLGARVLLYGPLNSVVHPQVVQGWIDALLPFEPTHESERIAWAFCLTQLSRKSGQRAIDIDDSHRRSVLTILNSQKVPSHWVRMVEEVLELEADEQSQMFGEALPIGLRLLRTDE